MTLRGSRVDGVDVIVAPPYTASRGVRRRPA